MVIRVPAHARGGHTELGTKETVPAGTGGGDVRLTAAMHFTGMQMRSLGNGEKEAMDTRIALRSLSRCRNKAVTGCFGWGQRRNEMNVHGRNLLSRRLRRQELCW